MITIVLTANNQSVTRLTDGINVFTMQGKLIQSLAVHKLHGCKVEYCL